MFVNEIVVSGTRPTGLIHLGNYFGAIQNYVKMQGEFAKSFFFIADYHSLTTHPFASDLRANVCKVLAIYLAAGLDTERCTVYFQSDVPEISELYLIMNMFAYKGELEKVPTFKEKVRRPGQTINAGLLTYPVLMAADILIHRAHKVPVGKDQEQHLEMTRNFAQRYNNLAGQAVFPEPTAFNYSDELIKIPGLDGQGKMSKSNENPDSAIYLIDTDEAILRKFMKAKTSLSPHIPFSPMPKEIEHLFSLLKLVSDQSVFQYFENSWNNCSIRFGDLKKKLAEDTIQLIAPLRSKIEEYESNPKRLKEIIGDGSISARSSAQETLKIVRDLLGFVYF